MMKSTAVKASAKNNASSKTKKVKMEVQHTDVATSRRSFQTRVPGSAENRRTVIGILNQHVADSLDLYSQTKHAHWNVKGAEFGSLHLLFDKIAEHVEHQIDLIAERSTALGGFVPGTTRQAAQNSRLPEYPMEVVEGLQHVNALADRIAALAQFTREAIDACEEHEDVPSSDLFTDVSRELEMDLWMLEAHLQSEARGRLSS
jgi:starvation-inducible DNA-binding protein